MKRIKGYLEKYTIFLLIVLSFLLYLPVLFGFFQQDELSFFGILFPTNFSIEKIVSGLLYPSIGHFVPLSLSTLVIFSYFFKLNYLGFAVVSVLCQIITVVIFYNFVMKLTKNKESQILATLIFSFAYAGYQATSWPVADINIHGVTIFSLLSFIAVLDKKILRSLVFLIVSLLFKEASIALFLLIPVTLYIFDKKYFIKNRNRIILSFLSVGLIYILFRIGLLIFVSRPTVSDGNIAGSWSVKHVIYNLVTFPFKSITQTLIPEIVLVNISKIIGKLLPEKLTGGHGTTQFDQFVIKRILEGVNFVFSTLVLLIAFGLRKIKDTFVKKVILFSLLFVGLNSLVFALSPETKGITTIIDSRNLYFLTIGSSIGLAVFLIYKVKNKLILYLILFTYLIINIVFLEIKLVQLAQVGTLRRNILTTIKNNYPTLPPKSVFYIESDTSYYGLPMEMKILPFQSGFGHTLMVWYYSAHPLPEDFFEGRFLWEIDSQGYKEVGSTGFGYFRDYDLLLKEIRQYNLSSESVVAFSWSSKTGKLVNITQSTRELLEKDVKKLY